MLTSLATIWLLHVAALATPGANTLLVTHLSASGGGRSAVFAALGVTLGAVVWSSAAILGVSVLFGAFPAVRLVLQIAGALYLIYLASRLWRAHASPAAVHASAPSAAAACRLGLLTNLSNPKSALFFGSVFSAALPAQPGNTLLFLAAALIVFNALWWHLLLAYLFSRPAVRAGYARQRALFSRSAGAIVGALGAAILISTLREARA